VSEGRSPAGWQPDPYGRYTYRYWDGTVWTEHVTDAAGTQTTDAPASVAPHDAAVTQANELPILGMVVVALGAVLIVLSLLVLDWFRILGRIDFTFSDVRDAITSSSDISLASDWFLSWGWYLGFAVIVVAAVALFLPGARWFAVAASGLFAIWQGYVVYDLGGEGVSTKFGAWLGAVGFVVCGIGVLLPRPGGAPATGTAPAASTS
jgi:hypothetical protein